MTEHRIEDLTTPMDAGEWEEWPWMVVGVLPRQGDPEPYDWWNCFSYTVGLGPVEVWIPYHSIEHRMIDPDLAAAILNRLAYHVREGNLTTDDHVRVSVGMPDEEGNWAYDADSIWWAGALEPKRKRQANMTSALMVMPFLWSSPLGWKDDDE